MTKTMAMKLIKKVLLDTEIKLMMKNKKNIHINLKNIVK